MENLWAQLPDQPYREWPVYEIQIADRRVTFAGQDMYQGIWVFWVFDE